MSSKISHYEGIGECIDHGKSKGVQKRGYARTKYKGVPTSLHRAVYVETHGIELADIKGLDVRHRCDNARCINPEHLLIGTRRQNIMDCVERGRNVKGKTHGMSKLTDEIVRYCRAHYVSGHPEFGSSAMARRFCVAQPAMSLALRGITWAHVGEVENEE
jgi:hypothetical protein